MQVADIIQQKGDRIVSIGPGAIIREAARTLQDERVGAALICAEDGKMLGIVSERDIVHGVARHGGEATEMPVSDIMTGTVITCSPETDTEELMQRMLESRVRHLPVLRDGSPVAMISIGDVVNAAVEELKWMRTTLQDQVMKSTVWSTEEDPD